MGGEESCLVEAAFELVHEEERAQPAKVRGKNTPGRRKSMNKCRGVCVKSPSAWKKSGTSHMTGCGRLTGSRDWGV